MTLPSPSTPPAATKPKPTPQTSAAVADEHGRVPPKSCYRPKIKQLKAMTQPSHPTAPLGATQPKRMSRSERQEAAKITRPCSECGTRFWSWKALFGHMRCHPNRRWRGIDPPPGCASRGPELVVPPADRAPVSEGASDAEVEAATSLILLKGEQTDGSNSDELPPLSQASRPRFTCVSCNKAFETPHGLGGHRAGHAKSTRATATRKRKASEEDVPWAAQLHRCDLCSMSFPSGQALGGHMSSHWKEESGQRAAAAEVAASSSTSRAGGCHFDLNLPAAEETEDPFFPSAFGVESDQKLPAGGFVPTLLSRKP